MIMLVLALVCAFLVVGATIMGLYEGSKLIPLSREGDLEDYLGQLRTAIGWVAVLCWGLALDGYLTSDRWFMAITSALGLIISVIWWMLRRYRRKRRPVWRLVGDKTRRILTRIKRKMRSLRPARGPRWVPKPA
jgi:hypothetical protein